MVAIHELREELRPRYGHYVNAAISLIGLAPYPDVLKSAREGDLASAHAAQIMHHRVNDPEREPFTGWESDSRVVSVPSWFAKPVPSLPKKLKLEQIVQLNKGSTPASIAGHAAFFGLIPGDKLLAGRADFKFGYVGKQKVMAITVLEQLTKGIKPRLSRQLEGWKNTAVLHLEKLAAEHGCSALLFCTAEEHSRSNNTDHPIHVELLETYGRLPMQHGFKLKVLQGAIIPTHGKPNFKGLWWTKAITRS